MRVSILLAPLALLMFPGQAIARPFTPEDAVKIAWVRSPDLSPDGTRVVYSVETSDLDKDKSEAHIWLANWDGSGTRQLTFREGESETAPKFSPDGTQIAFLSSRAGKEKEVTRLWLLPLAGGEAHALTGIEGSVTDFDWSPDGRSLALIVADKEPEPEKDEDGEEKPKPIVIDRYRFKQDGVGFLGKERERLFHYDLTTGKAVRLADGDFDEALPAFSPDGRKVLFVSDRSADPDRSVDSNLFIASLDKPGIAPVQLTTYAGSDGDADGGGRPSWSPDGTKVAYVRGGEPNLIWYAANQLAVIPATGGEPTILTRELDRNVFSSPIWSIDGLSLSVIVEDDGMQKLVSVPSGGGTAVNVMAGKFVLSAPSEANGRIAVLSTNPTMPPEVFALEAGQLRQLTRHNEALLADIELATPTYESWTSKDGTDVRGFVMLPPGTKGTKPVKTIVHPHGGPTAQYDYAFDDWQQIFASAGYAVLAVNPRGSTGRGTAFSAGIDKAWGSVDVDDELAAVDALVADGIADPDRLVVGGWSYGGMMTNYLIASDTRFKAAMSGASIGNIFAGYGTDHYVYEYEMEIGRPWENFDVWKALSYPFFQNDKIVTPTLFMVGGEDVNVPTLASEQMYQALKSRNIDSELVIYPGESHGFDRPSFQVDRMKRWLAWYAKYVK